MIARGEPPAGTEEQPAGLEGAASQPVLASISLLVLTPGASRLGEPGMGGGDCRMSSEASAREPVAGLANHADNSAGWRLFARTWWMGSGVRALITVSHVYNVRRSGRQHIETDDDH